MICTNCHQNNNDYFCQFCGCNPCHCNWVCIKTVYPPNDIIIKSLLISSGIPVKLADQSISQMPVAIGPMAEIKILVPEGNAWEAALILDTLEQSLPEEE